MTNEQGTTDQAVAGPHASEPRPSATSPAPPARREPWLIFWSHLAAWVLAVAAAIAPWLAIRYVPVEVNKWASIYVAGALGGLALELLLGRGRIELPGPSVATAQEQMEDDRRPLGTLLDLGFLARVASSGLAATALLLVYHALIDQAATKAAFNAVAADPSTFGWGIFLGGSSPAIWAASHQWVNSRITAVTAAHDAESAHQLKALEAAFAKLESALPRPTQVATDHHWQAHATVEAALTEAERASPGELDLAAMTDGLVDSLSLFAAPEGAPAADVDVTAVNQALGILEAGLADVRQAP